MWKKSTWNFLVDSLSLLAFSLMLSTGSILWWILPHGGGPRSRGGGGSEHLDRELLGFTRHQWGDVHAYVACVFLALLIIHVVLHWSWIRAMAWGTAENPKPVAQRIEVLLALAAIVLIIVAPWVLP